MNKTYIFCNPLAGNGKSVKDAEALASRLGCADVCDMTDKETFDAVLSGLDESDVAVICGGDGTLNRFANAVDVAALPSRLQYYPCGSGNDFARDVGMFACEEPFDVKNHLLNLPSVTVNDSEHKFINGIGYGIDGYCCEVGDELRKIPNKRINYTLIAIKGLLLYYRPTRAAVTVDGETHTYENVWLAPAMYGRYYGGGMMPTPEQSRDNASGALSVMVYRSRSKLLALAMFPTIFKGTQAKFKKHVVFFTGDEITVEFDRPTALQIDGETVKNVSRYTARSHSRTAAGASLAGGAAERKIG